MASKFKRLDIHNRKEYFFCCAFSQNKSNIESELKKQQASLKILLEQSQSKLSMLEQEIFNLNQLKLKNQIALEKNKELAAQIEGTLNEFQEDVDALLFKQSLSSMESSFIFENELSFSNGIEELQRVSDELRGFIEKIQNKLEKLEMINQEQLSFEKNKALAKAINNIKGTIKNILGLDSISSYVLRRGFEYKNERKFQIMKHLSKIYDNYFTVIKVKKNQIIDDPLLESKTHYKNIGTQLTDAYQHFLTKKLERKINTRFIENKENFKGIYENINDKKNQTDDRSFVDKKPDYIKISIDKTRKNLQRIKLEKQKQKLESVQRESYINKFKLQKLIIERRTENAIKQEKNIFKYIGLKYIGKGFTIINGYLNSSFKENKNEISIEKKKRISKNLLSKLNYYLSSEFQDNRTGYEILINKKLKKNDDSVLNVNNYFNIGYKANRDLQNMFYLKFDKENYYLKKDQNLNFEPTENIQNNQYIYILPALKYRIEQIAKKNNEFFSDYGKNVKNLKEKQFILNLNQIYKYNLNKSLHQLKGDNYKQMLLEKKDRKLMERVAGRKAPLQIETMYERLKQEFISQKKQRSEERKLVSTSLFSPLEKTKRLGLLNRIKTLLKFKIVFAVSNESKDFSNDSEQQKDAKKPSDATDFKLKAYQDYLNTLPQYVDTATQLKELAKTLIELKDQGMSQNDLQFIEDVLTRQITKGKRTEEERDAFYTGDISFLKYLKKTQKYSDYEADKKAYIDSFDSLPKKKQEEQLASILDSHEYKHMHLEIVRLYEYIKNTSALNKVLTFLNNININVPRPVLSRIDELFDARYYQQVEVAIQQMLFEKEQEELREGYKLPGYVRFYRIMASKSGFDITTYYYYEKTVQFIELLKKIGILYHSKDGMEELATRKFEVKYKSKKNNNNSITNYQFGNSSFKNYNNYLHINNNKSANLKTELKPFFFNKTLYFSNFAKSYKYDFIHGFIKTYYGLPYDKTLKVRYNLETTTIEEEYQDLYSNGHTRNVEVPARYEIKTKTYELSKFKTHKKKFKTFQDATYKTYVNDHNNFLYDMQHIFLNPKEEEQNMQFINIYANLIGMKWSGDSVLTRFMKEKFQALQTQGGAFTFIKKVISEKDFKHQLFHTRRAKTQAFNVLYDRYGFDKKSVIKDRASSYISGVTNDEVDRKDKLYRVKRKHMASLGGYMDKIGNPKLTLTSKPFLSLKYQKKYKDYRYNHVLFGRLAKPFDVETV